MTFRPFRRRDLLASTASLLLGTPVHASTLTSARPWSQGSGEPPVPARPGPWVFFTAEEAATVEALVDRLIPHDEISVSGKEAGCGVFIDRQLAGSYGAADRLYMRPPFQAGTPMQGFQSPLTPGAQYRLGLAALHVWCRAAYVGKMPADLSPDQRDALLKGLENGQTKLDGADGRSFFELLLANTMEGYFADPLYGGNKDFAGWKMLGFPGARYDYRDYVGKHNERFPLPPVGITGRPDWNRPDSNRKGV
jgi:gluconate 2-dehydrogenase gamma chain